MGLLRSDYVPGPSPRILEFVLQSSSPYTGCQLVSGLLRHPFQDVVDNFLRHLAHRSRQYTTIFAVAMTYTGEVVVGLFYIAQCMSAWGAGTICARVNECVVRRNDGIPETVEGKYVNVRWELGPGNRRVNRCERVVVFLPQSGRQQLSK